MQESLSLFRSLLKLRIFDRVNIYILLNKVDIFRRMISRTPISDYFSDYTGGADLFNACKFFADKFFTISNFHKVTTNIFPTSAVDAEAVLDLLVCLRDSSERDPSKRNLDPKNWATAWSWAAMDPGFSRERRSYMMLDLTRIRRAKPSEDNLIA